MLEFMFEQGKLIEKELQDYDLQEEMEDLIVSIFGLTKTRFNIELFDRVVKVLKNHCDYSMMNTSLACLYSSLLIVSYENPTSKIFELVETIEMVRTAGFRSRVSNMIGFALLGKKDIEQQVTKALKVYHIMHDYHGIITGEDDYLSTVYLAASDRTSKDIVAKIEEDYKKLGNLSFKKGNALQSLTHALQLVDTSSDYDLIKTVNELNVALKHHKIKLGGSQILIFALVGGLEISVEEFVNRLLMAMDDQLKKKNLKRLRSLHKTAIMLQIIHDMCIQRDDFLIQDKDYDFSNAVVMLMLTAYLYRERLV